MAAHLIAVMDLKFSIETLQGETAFREWAAVHLKAYLSFGFASLDSGAESVWQIGYYDPETDKATSFTLANGKWVVNPAEEVLKKPGVKVAKLDMSRVSATLAEAMGIATALQKEKYPGNDTIKYIVICQSIEGMGEVWNITMITRTFHTLNIKVAAGDGKVLEHTLVSVVDIQRKSPEERP